MHRLAWFALLTLVGACASAQGPARRLIDANPTLVMASGSGAYGFAPLDGGVAFLANDGHHGLEIWRSDGTPAGTQLVRDVAPGRLAGIQTGFGGELLAPLGAGLVFPGNSGSVFQADTEPWFTDGSPAGTTRILDLVAGVHGSWPTFQGAAGLVFFGMTAANGDREPWRTDGTAAGTFQLADIEPGPTGSYPLHFSAMGAACIFVASSAPTGDEPYVTDGTIAGTRLLLDLRPGPLGSDAGEFFHDGALTWFSAWNDVGDEPWVTDGTAVGTRMVADATPGADSTSPRSFVSMGGITYFIGNTPASTSALWRTDGTAAGTRVVMDAGTTGAWQISTDLHVLGSRLVFGATQEGPPSDAGAEPWASDGTTAGTIPLHVHPAGVQNLVPRAMSTALDHVFFWGDDGISGREPWRTDGTPAGTQLILDIAPGIATSVSRGRGAGSAHVNGRTWFEACTTDAGCEPWSSDGTAAGTSMARDIRPATTSSEPAPIANVEGRGVLALTNEANGREPWVSDGTEAGTWLLADIVPGSGGDEPVGLGVHRGRLYFHSDNYAWRTDAVDELALRFERYFFTGEVTTSASTPFGLVAPLGGPARVPARVLSEPGMTVELPPECSNPQRAVVLGRVGGLVAYSGTDGRTGDELNMTDGTIAGSRMVDDLPGSLAREARFGIELGDRLIIDGNDEFGAGTFITDGGTPVRLSDARPHPNMRLIDQAWRLGVGPGSWVAYAAESAAGIEPWVSDGTIAGTMPLADIFPGPGDSAPSWLTRVGSDVVFVATSPASGEELWITDGTPAGTRILVDLEPGAASSWPRDLVALSPTGPVAFTAHRSDTGRELWWTDGTAAGTRMLDETVAGPDDVDPIRLLAFGRHVMFDGIDDAGAEPWILDVPWADEAGNCRNGDDEDQDGLTDCADPDCATQPACDEDGDGTIDAEDCAPDDPGAWSVPAEVVGVTVTKETVMGALVSWIDTASDAGPSTRFEVALDSLDALRLRRIADAPCVARSLAASPWSGAPAGSWYLLVRAANACGPAIARGWGADSMGTESPACP